MHRYLGALICFGIVVVISNCDRCFADASAEPAAAPATASIIGAGGKTYLVPLADWNRLMSQSRALNEEEANLNERRAQIRQDFETLHDRLRTLNYASVVAVHQYNVDLKAAGAAQDQLNQDVEDHNAKVGRYNSDLLRASMNPK